MYCVNNRICVCKIKFLVRVLFVLFFYRCVFCFFMSNAGGTEWNIFVVYKEVLPAALGVFNFECRVFKVSLWSINWLCINKLIFQNDKWLYKLALIRSIKSKYPYYINIFHLKECVGQEQLIRLEIKILEYL